MSERETKEIKTPVDGHTLIIKTYLTGREYRNVEGVFLSAAKLMPDGTQQKEISGDVVRQAEDELIKGSVVSINGNTENVLDTVLDFKRADFAFVVNALNEMKYGEVDGKKKL